MKRSLTLMSIQYELSMSIGLDHQLKPMLRKFLEVSIKCLNLRSAHIYLNTGHHDISDVSGHYLGASGPCTYLSVPSQEAAPHAKLAELSAAIETLGQLHPPAQHLTVEKDERYYYLYAIHDFGVLLLERLTTPLDEDIVNALLPIVQRLGHSCRTAYEHEAVFHEIMKRQETQKALEASETLFRTVLENVVNCVITTDETGVIESINPATLALFGYTEEELIGQKVDLLRGDLDTDPYPLTSDQHILEPWFETQAKTKRGETIPVEISTRKLTIGERQLYSIIIRDISERKASEENLKTQLRFAKAFTDIAELLVQEDSANEIMDGVSTIIGETLKTDSVLIFEVDFKNQYVVCISEWINPQASGVTSIRATYPLRMFRNACEYIFDTGKWLDSHANLINPHLREDQSAHLFHQQLGIKSLLWYPFKFRREGYYLLVCHQSDQLRQWRSQELDFLNTVVQHVNMALNKAALLHERDQALEDLRLAATAFDAQEAMFITDEKSTIQRVNKAFTEITGYSEAEVIGASPRLLKSGRHDRAFYEAMWQALETQGYWRGEIWNRRKNGEIYPQWQTITAVKNDQGEVTHYISSFQDMTERKQAEAHIEQLAYYDILTGLPNRTLLMDRLQHELALSMRNNAHGAVLFLDLDRFKTINDSLGHSIGDDLLRQAAKRIESQVRTADTVARLGGDEFVIVLAQLSDNTEEAGFAAQAVAEKIRIELGKPYHLHDHEYQFTPSIGITLYPEGNETIDDVLKHADAAMYQAKSSGGNSIRFYQPDMQIAADERLALEKDLRRAMHNEELTLYYQPQTNHMGEIIGAEALLRWCHPERGMIPPCSFIPLAEETGQVLEIGAWVMRQAIQQIKTWDETGLCHITPSFAINVSPRQFHQADFVAQVTNLIEEADISPASLKLEITENIVMADVEDTIAKMEELRGLGVVFSIDDFGTGYSSLAYLKKLPLSQIKIDRSFVQDITHDANDATIVETIISMARHMNLDVLAEGVETAGQLSFLKQMGCYAYQGYYFSQPLPAEEFEKILKENRQGDADELQPV